MRMGGMQLILSQECVNLLDSNTKLTNSNLLIVVLYYLNIILIDSNLSLWLCKLLLYLTIVIEGTNFSSVQDNAHNKNHDLPNTRLSVDISTL
jgi:hypothetical protein